MSKQDRDDKKLTATSTSEVRTTVKRIAQACRGRQQKLRMVARHVGAKLRYGAYLERLDDDTAKRVELDIERAVLRKVGMGRSMALTWVLKLGHKASPTFWRDFEPIQARRRNAARSPQKQAHDSRKV